MCKKGSNYSKAFIQIGTKLALHLWSFSIWASDNLQKIPLLIAQCVKRNPVVQGRSSAPPPSDQSHRWPYWISYEATVKEK